MQNGVKGDKWPADVGILALELYFPKQYVRQSELALADGVDPAKYTLGLGQEEMGFCSDREDVNSLALTVVANLFRNYNVSPREIGRLEVGTETIVDKSKSTKSVLMQLWGKAELAEDEEELEAWSVEGLDTTNACFGGTQALFNALNWVESSAWDGRLALVVMADIAVYEETRARPTGGAGAAALLIGPKAPLVLDRGLRALHCAHVYDFYKPRLSSEYPTVDGPLSLRCYTQALDACYTLYRRQALRKHGESVSLDGFNACLFHSPFTKMVQKSLSRLAFHDVRNAADPPSDLPPPIQTALKQRLSETSGDTGLEKACLGYFAGQFERQTGPSLAFARRLGNSYTSSLYFSLASWLGEVGRESGAGGKRALLFSYGSGLASALFSLRTAESDPHGRLDRIVQSVQEARDRLEMRSLATPGEYVQALEQRRSLLDASVPYDPAGEVSSETFFPFTFYLKGIDDRYRRQYSIFAHK